MNFLTLHFLTLIFTAPVVLYADHMGFLYFTGRAKTLPQKKVARAHTLVFIGIILLVITGVLVTIPEWQYMLQKPFFYVKIAFVATLIMNGLFIGQLMRKATTIPYSLLEKRDKEVLLLSGALSAIGWLVTVLIGFFGL